MKRIAGCLLIFFMIGMSARAEHSESDFARGLSAYGKGDFAAALASWRPLAEQGNPVAQLNVGVMFAKGEGVAQDDGQAVEWIRKAASQGYAQARLSLANMYFAGRGVSKDLPQAATLYRQAAEQGNSVAQQNLANMYYKGQGVARDEQAAAQWYLKAAAQNQALAQYNVGVMYAIGHVGLEQDYAQAYLWLTLASRRGVGPAEAALEQISAKMSPEAVARGKALVERWRPQTMAGPGGTAGASSATPKPQVIP